MTKHYVFIVGSVFVLSIVVVCLSSHSNHGSTSFAHFSSASAAATSSAGHLVEDIHPTLIYHGGPILSGTMTSSIPIYVIWYGSFTELQKSIIADFFSSFGEQPQRFPTVSSWWAITRYYNDTNGDTVIPRVHLAEEIADDYSKGKALLESDLRQIVKNSLETLPANPKAVYFIFTAEDVFVDRFCRNTCGSHFAISPSPESTYQALTSAWVGNAASQCPGRCSWPFAKPMYGPQTAPLLPPNGDVGIEGMIVNIAILLAGTATNPFGTAYYQGDPSIPLEAGTACNGIFGNGSFPGHPGMLMQDKISGANYNGLGINGRKFLLPALWDPETFSCKPLNIPEAEVGDLIVQFQEFHDTSIML